MRSISPKRSRLPPLLLVPTEVAEAADENVEKEVEGMWWRFVADGLRCLMLMMLDFVEVETGGLSISILLTRPSKTRRNRKIHPRNSGTATVYLLPTYLPPTGVDNGIH